MIIAEDDVYFPKKFTDEELELMSKTLQKPKSMFSASNTTNDNELITIWATHFYIISQDACKALVKDMFPIDVQVDFYISHNANLGLINNGNKKIATQKYHKSSIQDLCFKCLLPDDYVFYLSIVGLFLLITIIAVTVGLKLRTCR